MRPISALPDSLPRSVREASMSEIGNPGVAKAALTSFAPLLLPAEWPAISLLQGSTSGQT